MAEQFGRYTLVKHIASGGMAEIWLALQPGPGGTMKPLVIKRILPHNVEHPEFLSMFLDEARIASGLNHSNIAQIYDVGEVGGRYFIAMEYVHGVDVRTLYRRLGELQRPLPIEVALFLVASISAGLHYAHEKRDLSGMAIGIVHRDVSPQNVLLDFGGAVKLIDFGIAKAQNKLGSTKSGVIKGKTAYLSPEQARGEELDARSDVFAAGVILYELTVGRRPFEAENDYGTVLKIASCDFKAPRAVRHTYPSSLERITLKAMAPNRDARFASARQLEEALRSWGHDNRLKLESLSLSALLHESFPDRARTDVGDEIAGATEGGVLNLPQTTPSVGTKRPAVEERTPGAVSRTGSGTADQVVARRRWLVPVIAGAALAVVGSIALYAMSSAEPATPDGPTARVDREPPRKKSGAAADDALALGGGTGAAKKTAGVPVSVTFESVPAGAEVLDKGTGETLGKTPFVKDLPTGSEPWRFEFRKETFAPYYTEVLIEGARKVEATMAVLPPGAPAAGTAAAGKTRPRPTGKRPPPTHTGDDHRPTAAPTPGSRIVDPFK